MVLAKNSLAMVLDRHPTQRISRRPTAEPPEHRKRSKGISSLPSRERHERPFRRRKREPDERDEGLQKNGDAFRAHAHVHAQLVLRADVQRFRRELDGGRDGVHRDAEVEVGLRSHGGGARRGVKDGKCDGYRRAQISRQERYVADEMWRRGFPLTEQGSAHALAR